ncbi:MAG: MBL fold metallo-hydrolase [Chloroflexota bacterium]
MRIWSLSSGSSGNCYLVQAGSSLLLMEAGIGSRKLQQEMALLGFSTSQLSAVLASHEHVDHWRSAARLACRLRIPLVCTPGSWGAGRGEYSSSPLLPLRAGRSLQLGEVTVDAFALPHDAREPIGFLLRSPEATVLLATDMGRMVDEVVERAREADLVILEANHDVEMLVRGPYPAFLKARILGDRGHLSNEDAARTIVRIAEGRPRDFWLAHLSHTNNSPGVALRSVLSVTRQEGLESLNVSVALRDRRSLSWDSLEALAQLPLF